MTPYRVQVRIELVNEETGRVVTYDTHEHNYTAANVSAHEPFNAIEDAIVSAIGSLSSSDGKGSK